MKIKMMAIVAMLAMAPTIASANAVADVQDRIGTDKIAHAACSYALMDVAGAAHWNVWEKRGAVLAVGVGKELCDESFDWHDLEADAAGILLHEIAHYEIRF
jgi:hypothetical protein